MCRGPPAEGGGGPEVCPVGLCPVHVVREVCPLSVWRGALLPERPARVALWGSGVSACPPTHRTSVLPFFRMREEPRLGHAAPKVSSDQRGLLRAKPV